MNDSASVGAPGAEIGERLARLESGQEWTKVILGLVGAVVIGGLAREFPRKARRRAKN